MQVQDTGTIYWDDEGLIRWYLPQFSDLLRRRLWSPKFGCMRYGYTYRNSHFHTSTKYKKRLRLTSGANDGDPLIFIRVGVTDEIGKILEVCKCTYNDEYNSYDGVLQIFDLQAHRIGRDQYIRLFCERISKTSTEVADAATQTEVETVNIQAKLKQDFEALLISEKDSDLIIKVDHRDFHVHRGILRARSSVFDSMLSHDLKEKTEGFINVEDIEPEVFEQFLLFVYSGKTEHLNSDNVCGLYYASDKYNVPDLKEKCISYLKKSFCVKNICEVISLAANHREVELLKLATEYFAKNMHEILVTCNWLQFMKDNPVEANELYIKSLKLGFTKKE